MDDPSSQLEVKGGAIANKEIVQIQSLTDFTKQVNVIVSLARPDEDLTPAQLQGSRISRCGLA
jgi:hypothetical protein